MASPPLTAPPGAQFTQTYYTYAKQVPLKPGEKLGFAPQRGYYVIAAPPSKAKPATGGASGGVGGSPNPTYTPDSGNPQSGYSGGTQTPYGSGPSGTGGGAVDETVTQEPDTAQVDWANYLSLFGLPQEIINYINGMKKTGNLEIDGTNILGYIRGTQWYANTYPGIAEAIAKGTVRDERDYRQQFNAFNQIQQQFAGTDLSTADFGKLIAGGTSADTFQRQAVGRQYVQANRNDLQYLSGAFGEGHLSEDQLTQVGQNKAGLGTQQGANYQSMLDKALQRMQTVFSGTLAGLGNAQSLAPNKGNPTDIGR